MNDAVVAIEVRIDVCQSAHLQTSRRADESGAAMAASNTRDRTARHGSGRGQHWNVDAGGVVRTSQRVERAREARLITAHPDRPRRARRVTPDNDGAATTRGTIFVSISRRDSDRLLS